jgi:hypothetical protein
MKGGAPVAGNNPLDANVVNGAGLQAGWVSHFVQRFGAAAAGGLKYYILDNEPSIWHSTHRDVRPAGATMEQVRDAMIAYAGAIKTVDPGALVVGPEEWGWSGYLFSGYDQQYGSQHGWSFLPDRAAHGGMDYLPWLLQQLKTRSDIDQRRVIDAFTVHYYPQGGEFWPPDDVSSAMQLRRNRSTRSLWDPAYTDETWINDRVSSFRVCAPGPTPTTTRARRSASPSTTGAPRITSTARPLRRTSTASSVAKGSTLRRGGRLRRRPHRPTKR